VECSATAFGSDWCASAKPDSVPMNRIQFQCGKCRLPTGSKPSIWWGDAKSGISSLSLKRKLSANYSTEWLLYNKIRWVMRERQKSYVLRGKVQLDNAYLLSGEHNGGKPGRKSENKVPLVAAVSLDEAGHPFHVKVARVQTFSFTAIADWAQDALAQGWEVISDGLACFRTYVYNQA
jgi:hypothetical protein